MAFPIPTAALPRFMIGIKPDSPKFARAYGGFPSSHRRPAVVTEVFYDEYGAVRGFTFAPITSTLNIRVVSHDLQLFLGLTFFSAILPPGQRWIGSSLTFRSLQVSTPKFNRSRFACKTGTTCERGPATSG